MKQGPVKSVALEFISQLSRVYQLIEVTASGANLTFDDGMSLGIERILKCSQRRNKVIFIGNGGSAAIASHQAVDYWKNGGVAAIAFNDASLLTCISNDFGYDRVFAEPVLRFASAGDVLIAISSSGQSANILSAVTAAREMKCEVITLSGFSNTNPLRKEGELNFYVPSASYGIVEVSHLTVLHAMLEEIVAASPAKESR